MELRAVQHFIAVVEAGSLRAAAARGPAASAAAA